MRSAEQAKIGREIFLRSFFVMRPPQRVAQSLVAVMRDHDFAPGDVIYEKGETPTTVYFVVEGEVSLTDDSGDEPWTFGEQSVIGIMDAVLDRPRMRRAVAQAPSHVLSIRYDDYIEVLEDNFDFAKGAMMNAYEGIHENARQLAPNHVFKLPETQSIVSPDIIAQRPLNLVERLLVFYNAPLFTDAPVQPLVSLAALADEERYGDGEVIFEPGEPATALRFVVTGRARAEGTAPAIVGHFGPGDLLGAHAGMCYPVTQYRMTAEGHTVLLRIPKEDLFDIMEDNARLVRTAFAFVARENERTRTLRSARNRKLAANA